MRKLILPYSSFILKLSQSFQIQKGGKNMPKNFSTESFENMDIASNLDKVMYVAVNEDNSYHTSDNIIHMFVPKEKNEEFETFKSEIAKWEKKEIKLAKTWLGSLLYAVIQKEYDGVCIHQIIKEKDNFFNGIFVSAKDVLANWDIIETVYYLDRAKLDKDSYVKTVYYLLNKYISYIYNISNKKNIYERKDEEGKTRRYLKVFLSDSDAEEFYYENKIDGKLIRETICHAVKNISDLDGILIEPDRGYGTYIDMDVLQDVGKRFQPSEEDQLEKIKEERYLYYKNTDKFYAITSTADLNCENAADTISGCSKYISGKSSACLVLFEKKKDAEHYCFSKLLCSTNIIPPVGMVTSKEMFENILQDAFNNHIEYVLFDAGTRYEFYDTVENIYKKLFDKEISVKDKAFLTRIPMANNIPTSYYLTKEKKQEINNILSDNQNINDKLVMKVSGRYSLLETFYIIHRLNDKIVSSLAANPKEKRSKEMKLELNRLSSVKEQFLENLIYKIMLHHQCHVVVDKRGDLVFDKLGYPVLLIDEKYVECNDEYPMISDKPDDVKNIHTAPFDFCHHTIEQLAKCTKFVTISDNCSFHCPIHIDFIKSAFQRIYENQKMRAVIMIYLIYRCHKSYDEAETFFLTIFSNKDLLNSFYRFVLSNETLNLSNVLDKEIYAISDTPACTDLYMAYMEYVKRKTL